LYGNPRVVVLDEPNSNLDEQGEAALASALVQLKVQQATVIVVTHRHNVLGRLDKLLILKDGLVAAYGGRDEVLAHLQQQQQQLAQQQAPQRPPATTFTVPI
jgi:ATP-binding cassette subfamily C protein EexD